MNLSELKFSYPEELIATEPKSPSRILLNEENMIMEISKEVLFSKINPGDVLVINDTKVDSRRIFGEGIKENFEILFIEQVSELDWKVLFPASRLKKQEVVKLPGNVSMILKESGIPQIVTLSSPLSFDYFEKYGEMPLPPYIQKSRKLRHNKKEDKNWYQTDWAEKSGSQAAPTASLHFTNEDIELLKNKGVCVEKVTLHVGLGTFLPVKTENLNEHVMHSEWCSISKKCIQTLMDQKSKGHHVWALGTTVTRTLESYAENLLKENEDSFSGNTNLFIKPGFKYKIVDRLLTNFHQPETTLLALVATFAGLENVKKTYEYAIQNKFRLFSYGDLSVWIPKN